MTTETIIKNIRKRSKAAGSKKGRQSMAHKGKYQKQFYRTAENKEKARKKHLEKHPNDLMAKAKIKELGE
mgnify:CR=1 FL=1